MFRVLDFCPWILTLALSFNSTSQRQYRTLFLCNEQLILLCRFVVLELNVEPAMQHLSVKLHQYLSSQIDNI